MSATGDNGAVRNDDAVEVLLGQASPRPNPPSEDEAMIREAVYSEWQAVTGRRRTRKNMTRFAIAATVLLGVAVSFNTFQNSGVAPVQVATIAASHGSIQVRGEEAQMHNLNDLTSIMSGQLIITDHDSGIGLAWGNGGSLRVAADTRIEFISDEEVFLHSGQIYFDSTPSELLANNTDGSTESSLRILTDHGSVSHLGTQYMTYSSPSELIVSVREGEVSVNGTYHDEKALAGQQLSFAGSARPQVANFPRHGDAWQWVEEVSPEVEIDGRSVDVFLNWVGREIGMPVEYPDEATRQVAQDEVLNAPSRLESREALAVLVETTDLNWYVEEGVIKVSAIDGGSGP